MAERVVLHIGTMKSGTSFVQSALASNPEVLDAAGARYLGGSFGRQAKAVRDVYLRPKRPGRHHKRWRSLAREARTFGGEAGIISMEFLSFAQEGQLEPFLAPLADLRVEVVLTVRDQFGAVPAQWQTFTRNFGTDDWETYLRRIDAPFGRSRSSRAAVTFHRAQDVSRILGRWSADPRVATVTVVTLPPPGSPRDELWRRFCQAVRLPAENAELGEVHENTSLGYSSCDVLRRLNTHLDDVRPRFYRKAMRPLAREALAPLREAEGRPELDRRGAELATDLNRRIHEAVTRGGYPVVGSLDDLPLPARVDAPQRVAPPRPDEVRRAALAVRSCAVATLDAPPGPPPDDLDDLVTETARLLRRANGWGL